MSLTDNLVSYWKLDESSGNASDSVGSNTATNTNVTYATGKINNGAVFNGSSAKLTIPDAALTANANHSVSFWVKINSAPGGNGCVLFEKFNGSGGWNYGTPSIGLDSSRNIGMSNRDSSGIISDGTFVAGAATGVWHHIAYVFDKDASTYGTIYGYYNGSLVFTDNNTRNFTDYNRVVQMGKSDDSFQGAYFNGMTDEIGIWSRALTSTEVTELYNSGNGKQYPFNAIAFIISEILALSETTTNIRSRLFTLVDSLSISETITTLKGISFTIVDSLGLIESFTSARTFIFNIIDNLGLVELANEFKYKWNNITKSISSWTNTTKNNSTFSNQTKNTSIWTNQNKS